MVFQLRSMLYSFSVGCYCYLLEAESSGSRSWCDWEGGNYLDPYRATPCNTPLFLSHKRAQQQQLQWETNFRLHVDEGDAKIPNFRNTRRRLVSTHVQYAKGVADASACPILSLLFIAASRLFCLPCTVLYDDNNDGNKDCCPARLDHRVL